MSRRGRKPDPTSATQQAAQYVEYMVRNADWPIRRACRVAAQEFRVNQDNVLRYARRRLKGKTVLVEKRTPDEPRPATWIVDTRPRVTEKEVPFRVVFGDTPEELDKNIASLNAESPDE
jgi:hypothetical protein